MSSRVIVIFKPILHDMNSREGVLFVDGFDAEEGIPLLEKSFWSQDGAFPEMAKESKKLSISRTIQSLWFECPRNAKQNTSNI